MRKHLMVALAVVSMNAVPMLASAGSYSGAGQFAGSVAPQVTELLPRFPAGGPRLRAAIAQLVEADPALADDVVYASLSASPDQKRAIGEGLADAVAYFAKCGLDSCRRAEMRIRLALSFADGGTRVGFVMASSFGQSIPGFNSAGAQTGGCSGGGAVVSPSSPGC